MLDCKFKKKKRNRKLFFPIRLRGGANNEGCSMIEKAIANAKAHDINVNAGDRTPGDGNCIFESVLNNINTRDNFSETFDGTADHWRYIWMTEVQNKAYSNWHGELTEERWLEQWHVLKNSRTYECNLGDLILPGVAHCVKKDVLIFNTSTSAHSPVYVIQSSSLCGQEADTEVPVCLGYNQVHYESLIPNRQEDIEKTVELKNQVINGNYKKTFAEIPLFSVETITPTLSYASAVKKNVAKKANSPDASKDDANQAYSNDVNEVDVNKDNCVEVTGNQKVKFGMFQEYLPESLRGKRLKDLTPTRGEKRME